MTRSSRYPDDGFIFNFKWRPGSGPNLNNYRHGSRRITVRMASKSIARFSSDAEKTLQYQDKLPSLPIPDLQNTLKKYLESVEPHLTEKEFEETKFIVQQFGIGIGRSLHKSFVKKAEGQRNWVNTNYPVYSCNGNIAVFDQHSVRGQNLSYIWHGRQKLRVDRSSKNEQLCMAQYMRMYNACKVPGIEKDQLTFYFKTEDEGPCPTHLTVICRGRMFMFDACDETGDLITPPEIQKQLQYIRDKCDSEPEGLGLGALTTEERTTWAKLYKHLKELHGDNAKNLKLIESSVLTLCMDDTLPVPENLNQLAKAGLLGNARQKWTDKSINHVVFQNGTLASNCDHAPFDGMVYIYGCYFTDECLREVGGKWHGTQEIRDMKNPEELVFHVDDMICQACDSIEVLCERYTGFGKNFIRKFHLHPDTFTQLALQLAYYRIYKKPAATYETATTRKYYHGRTETLRSCTTEAIQWAKAMLDGSVSQETKLKLFNIAHGKHLSNMVDCSEGKGCDRHLLALQTEAIEQGIEMPTLYTDKAFKLSGGGGNFTLSTSFTGYTIVVGGVAPMCQNGYGVFNNVMTDRITYFITCWVDDKDTSCELLRDGITRSLEDMRILLMSASATAETSRL